MGVVRRRLWPSWAVRATERSPLRFNAGKMRWTVSAVFLPRTGLWLLMMELLVAVVLYTRRKRLLSRWRMLLKSSPSPDKESLNLGQLPFPTLEAGMWLSRLLRLIWGNIYTVCFKESFLGAVNVFARQVLNGELDAVVEAYVQNAPKRPGVWNGQNFRSTEEISIGCKCTLCLRQSIHADITKLLPSWFKDLFVWDGKGTSVITMVGTPGRRFYNKMWILCCIWTVRYLTWTWRSWWLDIGRLLFVFLLQDRLGRVW